MQAEISHAPSVGEQQRTRSTAVPLLLAVATRSSISSAFVTAANGAAGLNVAVDPCERLVDPAREMPADPLLPRVAASACSGCLRRRFHASSMFSLVSSLSSIGATAEGVMSCRRSVGIRTENVKTYGFERLDGAELRSNDLFRPAAVNVAHAASCPPPPPNPAVEVFALSAAGVLEFVDDKWIL
jgi:hypothetical protein